LGDSEFGDGRGLILVGFGGDDVLLKETVADVVVVGAGVDWYRLLDGDFRSQRFVDIFLGVFVAFPDPIVDVNPGFLPLFERRGVSFVDAVGVFVGVGAFSVALDDRGIPNGMKIRSEAVCVFARLAPEIF